jgi:general stress protein 26
MYGRGRQGAFATNQPSVPPPSELTQLPQESGGIDILFFTNTESGKTDDLEADPAINIAFLDSSGQWASVSGTASVDTDRAIIKQHYTQQLKTWMGDLGDGKHDGGPEDPRIGAIRVKSKSITYSLFNRNMVGRTVEIAKGAITGETPGFNYIREFDEAELEQWRAAMA